MQLPAELVEKIKKIEATDFISLERMEELGRDYSFSQAVIQLREIAADLVAFGEGAELLRLPAETVNAINSIAGTVLEIADAIKAFVVKGNELNAAQQYQNIHERITNLLQQDYNVVVSLRNQIEILKIKPKELSSQATQATKVIKQIQEIKTQAEKAKLDVESAIKEVRDTLGKEGATIATKDFSRQAEEHQILSKRWLWGALWSIVLTFVVIVSFSIGRIPFTHFRVPSLVNEALASENIGSIIQVSLLKIVILSLVYLLVYQSIKNYRINRHLYVLNKHRQLTLSVYPFMANAARSAEQSDAIVAQAAKAIFDPGTTGYLDSDDNPNPVNITEIVNRAVEKK